MEGRWRVKRREGCMNDQEAAIAWTLWRIYIYYKTKEV